jgi:hypothetical protein
MSRNRETNEVTFISEEAFKNYRKEFHIPKKYVVSEEKNDDGSIKVVFLNKYRETIDDPEWDSLLVRIEAEVAVKYEVDWKSITKTFAWRDMCFNMMLYFHKEFETMYDFESFCALNKITKEQIGGIVKDDDKYVVFMIISTEITKEYNAHLEHHINELRRIGVKFKE